MTRPQDAIDRVAENIGGRRDELAAYFEGHLGELSKALPVGGMLPEQFVRIFLTTIRTGSQVGSCSRRSLLIAAFEAAALGLPVDGVLGHAYLVPRRVRGVQTACLQIGYRGFCELAYRDGAVAFIEAHGVREGDLLEYQHGTMGFLKYRRPLEGTIGDLIGAFGMVHLRGYTGPPFFRVLRRDEVERRRDVSASWRAVRGTPREKSSVWVEHEEAMFRKTAIRALEPTLPQSPVFRRAVMADELRDMGIQPRASFSEVPAQVPIDVEDDGKEEADAE